MEKWVTNLLSRLFRRRWVINLPSRLFRRRRRVAVTDHERNRELAGKAMDHLREGLAPFVARELKGKNVDDGSPWADRRSPWADRPVAERDTAGLLKLIWDNWQSVFRNILGQTERSLVSELRDWRNRWAHQETLSSDDAYRILDSASRLLAAVSAPQSKDLDKLKQELLRTRFDEQTRGERRQQVRNSTSRVGAAIRSRVRPPDEFRMFVPPCGRSFDHNMEYRLYHCPSTYSHKQDAAFLGMYIDKSVRSIGRIEKVVICAIDAIDKQKINTCPGSDEPNEEERQRIIGAAHAAACKGLWNLWNSTDSTDSYKVYLCGEVWETDFRKTSPGGIQGHRYLDLREVLEGELPENVQELAKLLQDRTWV